MCMTIFVLFTKGFMNLIMNHLFPLIASSHTCFCPFEGVRPGVRKPSTFTKPKTSPQQRMLPQQKKGDCSVRSTQPGVIPPEQMLSKPTVPSNNNIFLLKPEDKFIQNVPPANASKLPDSQLTNKEDNNGNVETTAGQNSTEVKEVQELEMDQSEVLR